MLMCPPVLRDCFALAAMMWEAVQNENNRDKYEFF